MQAEQLEAHAATVGNDVVVIGHSNGGIVARQWSQVRPVSALVTVGTPHRGAPIVPNLASYARLNLHLLSFHQRCVSRLFGSACCNWQSLLTSYSLWWNLAYDLASSSIVQIGASLGLTAGAAGAAGDGARLHVSVRAQLAGEPGCARASEVPTRVGIVSTAHNFYWGGALRAAFPDHGDAVAYWRDIARLGMDYAAAYLLAHADYRRLVSIRDRRQVVECVVFSVRDG